MKTQLDAQDIRIYALIRAISRMLRILSFFVFFGAWFFSETRIIIGMTLTSVGVFGITTVLINKYKRVDN